MLPACKAALQPLLPGVEVESIVGWDWTNDPLALGTCGIFRPGQLAQVLPDLRTTEGRLFFAGADSAIAWRSFIDGAIQRIPRRPRHRRLPDDGRPPGSIRVNRPHVCCVTKPK